MFRNMLGRQLRQKNLIKNKQLKKKLTYRSCIVLRVFWCQMLISQYLRNIFLTYVVQNIFSSKENRCVLHVKWNTMQDFYLVIYFLHRGATVQHDGFDFIHLTLRLFTWHSVSCRVTSAHRHILMAKRRRMWYVVQPSPLWSSVFFWTNCERVKLDVRF